MTKEISPNKAKQGRKGLPVLVVLICGLLLAAFVWWMVEIYGTAISPDDSSGDPAIPPAEDSIPIEPAPDAASPAPDDAVIEDGSPADQTETLTDPQPETGTGGQIPVNPADDQ